MPAVLLHSTRTGESAGIRDTIHCADGDHDWGRNGEEHELGEDVGGADGLERRCWRTRSSRGWFKDDPLQTYGTDLRVHKIVTKQARCNVRHSQSSPAGVAGIAVVVGGAGAPGAVFGRGVSQSGSDQISVTTHLSERSVTSRITASAGCPAGGLATSRRMAGTPLRSQSAPNAA